MMYKFQLQLLNVILDLLAIEQIVKNEDSSWEGIIQKFFFWKIFYNPSF